MIKYSIRGENLEVTEAIRDYVVSKLEKIEKYFQAEQELDARVNLKVYREKTAKVEVTIPLGSITLRAEDVSQDMYGSIDLVTDKIERQIRKNKTKIERKNKNKVATSQLFTDALVEEANGCIAEAHHAQTSLLTKEAAGEDLAYSVTMMHGQDHLMTTILLKDMMHHLIELYKRGVK